MEKYDIYKDIAKRTGGDIYIGVVGPVRTGKSTFVTKFMETLVLPNISNKLNRQIATDEMPQSADGKTIMTTEPKFIPANAVKIQLKNKVSAKVRLIDCVGYLVDGAMGHEEGKKPRLVKTPWSSKELPFEKAAELGTRKVIAEHSTIGVVVTTDGSFGEIPRANYVAAEERVVRELKELNKPFIILLNVKDAKNGDSVSLGNSLEEKYGVPVVVANATELGMQEINDVLEKILYEFPLQNVDIDLPRWMRALPCDNSIIKEITEKVKTATAGMTKMRDFAEMGKMFEESEKLCNPEIGEVLPGEGRVVYSVAAKAGLFYDVLTEESGDEIKDDYQLMSYIKSLAEAKREYGKIRDALKSAEETGYGIVTPTVNELSLSEPELVKRGGSYGVKLKATAPSLHVMKVDVSAEVNPIVGTEKQGEELVNYLMKEFESNPQGIWDTNMFGKSLRDLMEESLSGKIKAMPEDARSKMCKTLGKIVNEGDGGIICILL